MSYDLLAFDPAATTDLDFARWWEAQSEWPEEQSYQDPAVTTGALQSFYRAVIAIWPPLNGPDAPSDDTLDQEEGLEQRPVDYTFGRQLVFGSAGWSQAQAVQADWVRLAKLHGVAIAEISETPVRIHRP